MDFFVAQSVENKVMIDLVLSVPRADIVTSYANVWVAHYRVHTHNRGQVSYCSTSAHLNQNIVQI